MYNVMMKSVPGANMSAVCQSALSCLAQLLYLEFFILLVSSWAIPMHGIFLKISAVPIDGYILFFSSAWEADLNLDQEQVNLSRCVLYTDRINLLDFILVYYHNQLFISMHQPQKIDFQHLFQLSFSECLKVVFIKT